jgi:hypothetical protein
VLADSPEVVDNPEATGSLEAAHILADIVDTLAEDTPADTQQDRLEDIEARNLVDIRPETPGDN